VNDALYNPVYNALRTGDADLGNGTDKVKYFDEEVSPFVGFAEDYNKGFDELYDILPANRKVLYATPQMMQEREGWKMLASVKGLQFVFVGQKIQNNPSIKLLPLDKSHAAEMVQLAALTKPGPFNMRTIQFGHYYGIFDQGKLVAMTGQRLHVENYTEVSAVCTHPDHLGKGYAAALMRHQINLILNQGKKPFLHVRADNERAIALYERLQFKVNRDMNFYFMKKEHLSIRNS
jgi:ribosomal protein S18 acetylase RimI-like enzyme